MGVANSEQIGYLLHAMGEGANTGACVVVEALYAAHRRTELQALYRKFDQQIGKLGERVREQA